jgi:hypothetical protein
MKTTLLSILLSALLFGLESIAQRGHRGHHHRGGRHVVVVKNARHVRGPFRRTRLVVVRPNRPRTISVFPGPYVTIGYRGVQYHICNGLFYRPATNGYLWVVPPRGIRVRALPYGFVTLSYDNPVYYHQGVYYKPVSTEEFEVVDPVIGARVPALPDGNVEEVNLDGENYLQYDNTLYRRVEENQKVEYEVLGPVVS